MTDPYLLLTPVLALAVLALARFVGCDVVFRLDEIPPRPPGVPFVKDFVPGMPRTDPFIGWVGMVIRVGGKPITVTQLGRIMLAASNFSHEVKLVRPAGASGGVDLGAVTIPPSAAVTPSADNQGFAYATLQTAVPLEADTEYYVVSHEAFAMGDEFHDVIDTTVTTTAVAEVRSGVFNDDNDNPDAGYQRSGAPGNTYGPVDFKYEEPA